MITMIRHWLHYIEIWMETTSQISSSTSVLKDLLLSLSFEPNWVKWKHLTRLFLGNVFLKQTQILRSFWECVMMTITTMMMILVAEWGQCPSFCHSLSILQIGFSPIKWQWWLRVIALVAADLSSKVLNKNSSNAPHSVSNQNIFVNSFQELCTQLKPIKKTMLFIQVTCSFK